MQANGRQNGGQHESNATSGSSLNNFSIKEVQEIIRKLLVAPNLAEEATALRRLVVILQNDECSREREPMLKDKEVPPQGTLSFLADCVLEGKQQQSLLGGFLLYFFIRKFFNSSPSDLKQTIMRQDDVDLLPLVLSNVAQFSVGEQEKELIESLQDWLLRSPWSSKELQELIKTLQTLEDPRLRQHSIQFSFGILDRQNYSEKDEPTQNEALNLVLLASGDVWSAIRKDAAKNSRRLLKKSFLPLSMIESLAEKLLQGAQCEEKDGNDWKRKEGALLSLTALLQSYHMETSLKNTHVQDSTTFDSIRGSFATASGKNKGSSATFSIGKHTGLAHLPLGIVQRLKATLYTCLKHPQLSMREIATSCLISYMDLCTEFARLATFQEIMSKLNMNARNLDESIALASEEENILDAAEAEGLLDAFAHIVREIPCDFLRKHWHLIFPTLDRYVMHLASTVRQKSSAVVQALALTASSSLRHGTKRKEALELLRMILQSFSQPLLQEEKDDKVAQKATFCWQKVEGRMLSIDLLTQLLGKDLLHTFAKEKLLQSYKNKDFLRDVTPLSKIKSSTMSAETSEKFKWHQLLERYFWANDQVSLATWLVHEDEDEEYKKVSGEDEAGGGDAGEREQADLQSKSLLEELSGHLQDEWMSFLDQFLSGWLQQTFYCFSSNQFELIRIASQVLPGLIRLFVWTDKTCLLFSQLKQMEASRESSSSRTKQELFEWNCLKYLLLHIRFLQEFVLLVPTLAQKRLQVISLKLQSKIKQTLEKVFLQKKSSLLFETKTTSEVTDALLQKQNLVQNLIKDPDLKNVFILKTEVFFMANVVLGTQYEEKNEQKAIAQIIHFTMEKAIDQVFTIATSSVASAASIDRALSIATIRLLPSIAATISFFSSNLEQFFFENTTSSSRLVLKKCLLQVVLKWLMTQDNLRWITIDAVEAQSYLLDTLALLLSSAEIFDETASPDLEVDKVLEAIEKLFFLLQDKSSNINVLQKAVHVCVHLWQVFTKEDHSKRLLLLMTQFFHAKCGNQHHLSSNRHLASNGWVSESASSFKTSTTVVAATSQASCSSAWDDWDEDEESIDKTSSSQREAADVQVDFEALTSILAEEQHKLVELRQSAYLSLVAGNSSDRLTSSAKGSQDAAANNTESLFLSAFMQMKAIDSSFFEKTAKANAETEYLMSHFALF